MNKLKSLVCIFLLIDLVLSSFVLLNLLLDVDIFNNFFSGGIRCEITQKIESQNISQTIWQDCEKDP